MLCVLFGLGVVMHLFAQQHVVLDFVFWAKIHLIYSYNHALAGTVKVEKIKQKQEVLEVLDGVMFRGIFGPFSVAQKAFMTLFLLPPRTGPALAQSPAVCGSKAEMEKQTHTHTHAHTHWLWCGFWRGGAEFCLLNRGGWMGDRRNEWGAKSSTLTALFILHAHTPIQDICDANSAQESKLCLLGSSLCVCVGGSG